MTLTDSQIRARLSGRADRLLTVPISGSIAFNPPSTPNDASTPTTETFTIASNPTVNVYQFSATGTLSDGQQEGTTVASLLVYYPIIDPVNTSPTYVLVAPGGSASYTFTDQTPAADGAANWNVWSSIPPSSTATFLNATTSAPPHANTLTIQTSASTPTGEYAVGIAINYNAPLCRQSELNAANVLIDVETPSPSPSPSPVPSPSQYPTPGPTGCGGGGTSVRRRNGKAQPQPEASGSCSLPTPTPAPTPSILVSKAAITSNAIAVAITGSGLSGTLTISANYNPPYTSTNTKYVLYTATKSAGNYSIPFWPTGDLGHSLPKGEYTSITGTWNTGTTVTSKLVLVEGTASKQEFFNMGQWRNSQYNIADEKSCTGSKEAVTLYNPSGCKTMASSFKSDFASAVHLNGTGRPLLGMFCKYEFSCGNSSVTTAFDYPISKATGACSTTLSTSTVAAPFLGSSSTRTGATLACGDQVLEVGSDTGGAVKSVTDECPDCESTSFDNAGNETGNIGHLDNFTTSSSCAGKPAPIGDLANSITIRLR